jgi:uncharacterized protein YndB with AHSA1/START domain
LAHGGICEEYLEIDLRPGRAYRFVNRRPDGTDYGMKVVYREIVPPERLVYTEGFVLASEQGGDVQPG